ncbi:MAG TPA: cation:proton antiporter [Anaerolineales bacterium]|nr:cation:proton antiporter [Anaerolineales bacterium]
MNFIIFLAAFLFIALASRQIGDLFKRYHLPLISGFLVAGLVAGPYVLGLFPAEAVGNLRFIDRTALAFIAFAAGGELQVRFVRGNLRGLLTALSAQTVVILIVGILAFILLADQIPFMQPLTRFQEIFAIALLAATIMVARSPSSVLAIIKETRAKGKFTSMVMGVTVLTDAVVIIVFATAVSIASGLVGGGGFTLNLLAIVVTEIAIDIVMGVLIGLALRGLLSLPLVRIKPLLILALGYGVFTLSAELREFHLFGLRLFSEPLLICMTAGFYLVNYTRYRGEFHHVIDVLSVPVFIAFFTAVGIALNLQVLTASWIIILVLVVVRFAGLYLGSLLGGIAAGDPMKHNLLYGFAYITQAGVSVGLAKEVAVEFSPWGDPLATLLIGGIVVSQLIGPPFFKWVLGKTGEAHPRAGDSEFDGVRDALIFGLDNQSLALARQLKAHGWQSRIICCHAENMVNVDDQDVEIVLQEGELDRKALKSLGMDRADAVVALLSDDENYRLCELNYEHFGVRDFIVLLDDRNHFSSFHELGALIVDPATAIVSLLDHLVRSPVAASLILGMEDDHDIIDLEVRDPDLHGVAIRDLQLPADVLIMAVSRNGHPIISMGHTRLYLKDQVTLVGSRESLDQVTVMFD